MNDFEKLLFESGEISKDAKLTPLAGGVSSDIYLVEDNGQKFVVKRALEKLKVKADWYANTSRNMMEYQYMQIVSEYLPNATPKVKTIGKDYFTMEYLEPSFENWKQLLLQGKIENDHGKAAGEIMGTIHSNSFKSSSLLSRFDTTDNFEQLRLEPYLRFTAAQYPKIQKQFLEEAERIKHTRVALVHGDFSPKNILIQKNRMVLLDCEVAWFGDPAFDCAFLVNHFALKAIYQPNNNKKLKNLTLKFREAYDKAYAHTFSKVIHKTAARLQWMLMLARVDGKSPAEYLTDENKNTIRNLVLKNLTPEFSPNYEDIFEMIQ